MQLLIRFMFFPLISCHVGSVETLAVCKHISYLPMLLFGLSAESLSEGPLWKNPRWTANEMYQYGIYFLHFHCSFALYSAFHLEHYQSNYAHSANLLTLLYHGTASLWLILFRSRDLQSNDILYWLDLDPESKLPKTNASQAVDIYCHVFYCMKGRIPYETYAYQDYPIRLIGAPTDSMALVAYLTNS